MARAAPVRAVVVAMRPIAVAPSPATLAALGTTDAAESPARRRVEVILQLADGATLSVVEPMPAAFHRGDTVLVQRGLQTRVLPRGG